MTPPGLQYNNNINNNNIFSLWLVENGISPSPFIQLQLPRIFFWHGFIKLQLSHKKFDIQSQIQGDPHIDSWSFVHHNYPLPVPSCINLSCLPNPSPPLQLTRTAVFCLGFSPCTEFISCLQAESWINL